MMNIEFEETSYINENDEEDKKYIASYKNRNIVLFWLDFSDEEKSIFWQDMLQDCNIISYDPINGVEKETIIDSIVGNVKVKDMSIEQIKDFITLLANEIINEYKRYLKNELEYFNEY